MCIRVLCQSSGLPPQQRISRSGKTSTTATIHSAFYTLSLHSHSLQLTHSLLVYEYDYVLVCVCVCVSLSLSFSLSISLAPSMWNAVCSMHHLPSTIRSFSLSFSHSLIHLVHLTPRVNCFPFQTAFLWLWR